jgi:protocatechuate 3,4-dioxygenase beta subunit
VTLGRGEEKSVELRLGPGRFVNVRVTDGEGDDAEPIAAARVTLAEGGLSSFPLVATTDGRGHARIGPIGGDGATLSARAEGYVPRGAVAVADPPPAETRVVLVRAASLAGRVVDARGDPVDGATIEVAGTDLTGGPVFQDPRRESFQSAHFDVMLAGPRPLVPAGELGVVPGPVPPVPAARMSISPANWAGPPVMSGADPWVTRGDGTFRAYPVSPGRLRAIVHHPQYVEAESTWVTLAPGGEASVEVVMHEGGTLEGRVLDAHDRPVAGARVFVSSTRGALEKTTRTASDGTFAFAALPESVTLSAGAADEETAEVRLALAIPAGGRQEVTVHLPEARAPLAIAVLDARSSPVDAAQITALSLSPDCPFRATVFTDSNGEATLPRGRGLPLRIEIRAPSHAPRIVTTDALADSLRVELASAESASGVIVAARGREPVRGAEVTLYTDLGARHARTDREGAFALTELAPGEARLRVSAAGFAAVTAPVTIPDTDGRRPLAIDRVEMAAEGVVDGVVVDSQDRPVPGARVAQDRVPTWLVVGSTPEGLATTDARGRFHLGGLPEDTITLEAYAPDWGRATTTAVVRAGRTTGNVRLVLGADAGPSQQPATAASVAVTLGETGAPVEVVVVSVADGSQAERAGLAPGDVLTEVDGVPVGSIEDARARLSGPLADDVLISVRRGDQTLALRVEREPVRR